MSFPIVICDDSSIARRLVKKSLPESLRNCVFDAENGQTALDILEQEPITLLFLDLTMPVMDGVEVLNKIREKGLETFVIVITGDIQPEMERRVMELGALAFLKKPLDKKQLSDTLIRFGLY